MLADFKAVRENQRSVNLKHARQDRARHAQAKQPLSLTSGNSHKNEAVHPRAALRIPPADIVESKQLVASPPLTSAGLAKEASPFFSDLSLDRTREVLLVDLPRKAHKQSEPPPRRAERKLTDRAALSSTFEIVSLPRVIALSESMGPQELEAAKEEAAEDWDKVDDFVEVRASYAEAAKGA
jgi:hypothetical protein